MEASCGNITTTTIEGGSLEGANTTLILPITPTSPLVGSSSSTNNNNNSNSNNNNNNNIQRETVSDSYSSESSSSSNSSSSSSQQQNPTQQDLHNNNTIHFDDDEKRLQPTTPIKSNFLTKEEEEENQQIIIHSSRGDEQQDEKQQEELLALQNQIFLSHTGGVSGTPVVNTNGQVIDVSYKTSSIGLAHNQQQQQLVQTPPSRSRILSNVSSTAGLNQDSLVTKDLTLTPTKQHVNNLTSPKGSEKSSSSRHFGSTLFDSADLEEDRHQMVGKLSTLENTIESLKLMKKKYREYYLPETFLNFCKHETSKIYGWSLESEKHSVQFYNKSISVHSLTTGDFSAISRLTSQNTLESTSTQDLSKNLRFKQTPIINDSVNYVIANRFVGILSDTNFKDAYLACKDIQLRKQTKQMEEVVVLENYYYVEGPEITDSRKSKVQDESFDIIYQRTSSPNTLFVSKREYLTARYFIEGPERLIILERSIDKVYPIPAMLQSLTIQLNDVKNNEQLSHHLSETNTPHQSSNSLHTDISLSPQRQRSRSVGMSNSARPISDMQLTPLSARTTTSSHILQQSAPNLNLQSYPNDSLKNTLANSTTSTQKGVVRANILFQILIFDRLSETETKFQIINNVDVKGWLKSWNSLTQKSTPHKIFEDFVDVIDEYKKNKQ